MTTCSSPDGALDGELDVAEHPVGVGVGDEQGTGEAGGRGGELVAVDQADAGLDRVDPECGPGDVEERQRREDVDVDALVGAQTPHRALEDERRTRHGVEDPAVLDRRGDEPFGDLGVHVGERVGVLVDVVERRRPAATSAADGCRAVRR